MEGESLSPERLSPKTFVWVGVGFGSASTFSLARVSRRPGKKAAGLGSVTPFSRLPGSCGKMFPQRSSRSARCRFPVAPGKRASWLKNGNGLLRSSGREGRTARGMPETGRRGVRMRRRLTDWGGSSAWFIREACRIGLCRVRFSLRVMFQDFGNDNGGIGEGDSEREAQCQRREQSEVRFFQGGEDWSAQSDHERDEQGMNRNRAHRSPP